jgi:glycine hydroxymethyltransferase
MMLDLRETGVTGKELEHRLDSVNITANKNMIPGDPASPFVTSGVRLGTPSVTTRGFGTEEMEKIAEFIAKITFDYENSAEEVKLGVAELCKKFPLYE